MESPPPAAAGQLCPAPLLAEPPPETQSFDTVDPPAHPAPRPNDTRSNKRQRQAQESVQDQLRDRAREAAAGHFLMMQAQQQLAAEASTNRLLQRNLALQLRAVNTRKNYKRYADRFKAWCDDYYAGKGVSEQQRHQVTKDKVETYFIQHLTVSNKLSGTKKVDGTFGKLSPATLEQHLCGIKDLWRQQKDIDLTNNDVNDPAPDKAPIRSFLANYAQIYHQELEGPHFDRATESRGTQLYTLKHHQRVCTYLLEAYQSVQIKLSTLRDRLVVTWQWAGLLRCNVALQAELSRLSLEPLLQQTEGIQRGNLLVLDIRRDKRMKADAIRHKAMFRHSDWQLCPHGALAFWLFWRFSMSGEPFPDFSDTADGRVDWVQRHLIYDTSRRKPGQHAIKQQTDGQGSATGRPCRLSEPLLHCRSPSPAPAAASEGPHLEDINGAEPSEAEIDNGQRLPANLPDWGPETEGLRDKVFAGSLYGPVYRSIKNAFHACHVRVSKALHAQRGGGARHLENSGLHPQIISRMGSWCSNESMTQAYLIERPIGAMRVLGGHHKDGNRYYISRAKVEPPQPLLEAVFPALNPWLDGRRPEPRMQDSIDFIQVLSYLRTVLLQDAALLKQLCPQHFLFEHSLFKSELFLSYASTVQRTCGPQDEGSMARAGHLQTAVELLAPDLHRRLDDFSVQLDVQGSATRSHISQEAEGCRASETAQMVKINGHLVDMMTWMDKTSADTNRFAQALLDVSLQEAGRNAGKEMSTLVASGVGRMDETQIQEQILLNIQRYFWELVQKVTRLKQGTVSSLAVPLAPLSTAQESNTGAASQQDAPLASQTSTAAADLQPAQAASAAADQQLPLRPPVWRMKRGLKTVFEAVAEWYEEDPCVAIMEANWGTQWRVPQPTDPPQLKKDKKPDSAFYLERRKLIRRLDEDAEALALAAWPSERTVGFKPAPGLLHRRQAAQALECLRLKNGWSLKDLQDYCQKEHTKRLQAAAGLNNAESP